VLCLDAMTGEVLWNRYTDRALEQTLAMRRRVLNRAKWELNSGGIQHAITVDGCLVCAAGIFDGKTGERSGEGVSVPTRWTHRGKQYLMSGNACLDVRAGKTLWQTKLMNFGMARGNGSPALSEDYAADFSREGLSGYRIGLHGVEELWTIPGLKAPSSAVVIHKGYVAAATSDESGRLLIAVEVATGKEAGRLYYDQKGSKHFPPSHLNNLCCGITGATALDGRVFWRRYRNSDPAVTTRQQGAAKAGGLGLMNLPVDGREFSVQAMTFPILSYGHTPAAADGRLFFRMQGFMRCLDFRKDPPPVRPVPPDPACNGLAGSLARLGSAYRSERDAAVRALAGSASAAQVSDLVRLAADGRYPTSLAAAAVLAEASAIRSAAGPALVELVDARGAELPATRLGRILHALHAAAPEMAVAATRRLLDSGDGAAAQVGRALGQPVFADDIGLIKAVLPELHAALSTTDAAGIAAVGEALVYLDLEPERLTPLVGGAIAAMRRTDSSPFTLQRAVTVGLEGGEEEPTFRQAIDYVVEHWDEPAVHGTFALAVVNACPVEVAAVALPKLAAHPHPHREGPAIERIGSRAIPALMAQYARAGDRKAQQHILLVLRKLGPEGERAARELERQ
jgi:hypothetical protein